MHGKSGLVRSGAAVLTAALALLVAAPVAGAASGEAKGRVDHSADTEGFGVNFGGKDTMNAILFSLKLTDGSRLKMYCVEYEVGLREGHDMVERPWDKYPNPASPFNKNSAKISWALHHGYPANEPTAMAEVLTKKGVTLHDGVSKEEALSATQAAVWHFSDGKNVNREKPLPYETPEEAADFLSLYDYLVGDDNTGTGEQVKPTLNIAAKKTEGPAGTRIGPFTVATTGEITDLASQLPKGVKITDADGKQVKTADVKNGTELYVDVPKDAKAGTGSFVLKAIGQLETGRLFVSDNYAKEPSQSLIVAQSEKIEVTAEASARWTQGTVTPPTSETTTPGAPSSAAPTPPTTAPSVVNKANEGPLPTTGVNAAVPISIGVLLVLGGGVMLLLLRRRRKNAA